MQFLLRSPFDTYAIYMMQLEARLKGWCVPAGQCSPIVNLKILWSSLEPSLTPPLSLSFIQMSLSTNNTFPVSRSIRSTVDRRVP